VWRISRITEHSLGEDFEKELRVAVQLVQVEAREPLLATIAKRDDEIAALRSALGLPAAESAPSLASADPAVLIKSHLSHKLLSATGVAVTTCAARALHAYKEGNPQDLFFDAGTMLTVTKQGDDGWWTGYADGAPAVPPPPPPPHTHTPPPHRGATSQPRHVKAAVGDGQVVGVFPGSYVEVVPDTARADGPALPPLPPLSEP
jgi:hypothetical protein